MCVRTYTHTHVHIPGAGRKLSGLMLGSEHSEIEPRFPCTQKRSAQREKGNGQWTERCLEFPKSCAWRGTGVNKAVNAAESQETKDSIWDQWHLTSYLKGKQVSSGGNCGLLCFCAHFQLGLAFFQANLVMLSKYFMEDSTGIKQPWKHLERYKQDLPPKEGKVRSFYHVVLLVSHLWMSCFPVAPWTL